MQQNWTEVTDVNCNCASIDVWLGRRKSDIQPGDRLTFVGETNENLFKNGRTYTFCGYSWGTDCDYTLRDVNSWTEVGVYMEDMEFYLLEGDFNLHDV